MSSNQEDNFSNISPNYSNEQPEGGKRPEKALVLLGIVAAVIVIIFLLVAFKPTAPKQKIPETVIKVDVVKASSSNYPLVVNTSGVIAADTRGNMVAQVQGEIVSVSDQFKTGGAFTKGDVLLEIDDRDYAAEVSRSAAALSQAKASYQQEMANSAQAKKDWARLGNTTPAPSLVLRKPQLSAAKAQLDSATAAKQSAQLNLSRTKIKAPYDGRVIRRNAALGQFVSMGTVLAETFATDVIEVKLPLSQYEYSQLGLDSIDLKASPLDVVLSDQVGNNTKRWSAKLTRTDSTFDSATRQINAVATVSNPFSDQSQATLKIGQFVNAKIQGPVVNDVFVLPNKSIREGNSVFVVNDLRLVKKPVEIIWQDDQNALVKTGLSNNELVVTTSLNGSVSGSKVKLPESIKTPAKNERPDMRAIEAKKIKTPDSDQENQPFPES